MFAVVIGHNFTFCINTHPKHLREASLNTTNPQVLVGNIKIGTAVNLDNSRKLLSHSSVHSNFLFFCVKRDCGATILKNRSTNRPQQTARPNKILTLVTFLGLAHFTTAPTFLGKLPYLATMHIDLASRTVLVYTRQFLNAAHDHSNFLNAAKYHQ